MPPYAKPNDQWLADTLRKQAAGVAANSAQQTNFIIDPTGKAWVIIGNLTNDNVGNATGIGSATAPLWGIAALDGSGAWQHLPSSSAYGRVTADIAGTGSMADVPGMGFAVGPGEVWSFSVYVFIVASVAGSGSFTFQFTGPSSPSSFRAAGMVASSPVVVTAFSSAMSVSENSGTTETLARISGTLVNGPNAGTVQLQQENVTITQTVKAGSYLLATKGA